MTTRSSIERSKRKPVSFKTLLEDVVPVIVKEIRRWAYEEEAGREWRERRDERRR